MNKKLILLQVAMEVECQELLKILENKKETIIEGYQFYEGIISNVPVVILLSRVGLIETSSAMTIALTKYHPVAVINFGIAGATSKNIHRKDIVIGEKVININSYRTKVKKENEGCNPMEWDLLTFLSGEEDRFIEQSANQKLIDLTKKVPNRKESTIYYGKIGSGDVWNQEIDRMLDLNKRYEILCEDMESIATYTICSKRNIPVVSIKMISDNAITGEEYQREIGILVQEYIVDYLKIINKEFIGN